MLNGFHGGRIILVFIFDLQKYQLDAISNQKAPLKLKIERLTAPKCDAQK